MVASVTFEMEMGHDGLAVPEWRFRGKPVLVNVSLDALKELHGPLGDLEPRQILEKVRSEVEVAARRKIGVEGEGFQEPVMIDVIDL
jgi:hypothetical protein